MRQYRVPCQRNLLKVRDTAVGTSDALTISMKVIVHTTVQTMTGEGLEALAPRGEWIAVFSEGNLLCSSISLSSNDKRVTDDTLVIAA